MERLGSVAGASLCSRQLTHLVALDMSSRWLRKTLLRWPSSMRWRTGARPTFCGRCGAPGEVDEAGYRLLCVNGHMQFPRTDPVTVILICHGDRVFLARGTTFPNKRLFSALSGFVEAGETTEQTARREAFEEVGVRARALRYHSSQPWGTGLRTALACESRRGAFSVFAGQFRPIR